MKANGGSSSTVLLTASALCPHTAYFLDEKPAAAGLSDVFSNANKARTNITTVAEHGTHTFEKGSCQFQSTKNLQLTHLLTPEHNPTILFTPDDFTTQTLLSSRTNV